MPDGPEFLNFKIFIILNTQQLCCWDKGHTYSTDVCFSSTGFRFHAAAPRMPRSSAARVRRRRFTIIDWTAGRTIIALWSYCALPYSGQGRSLMAVPFKLEKFIL